MSVDLLAPTNDGIQRDRYGRYMIIPPTGSKSRPYTRATTIAKALDDTYNLEQWKLRICAQGLATRPDLIARIATTSPDDKNTLNQLCTDALAAGQADTGANLGTALHSATETHDRGQKPKLPSPLDRDLDAYIETIAANNIEILPRYIEGIVVNDDLEIAGTFDRLVRLPTGQIIVADLKGLALDTPIPTPDGWTTMGAIQEGDIVFGSDGVPCAVVAKSEIHWRDCYRITFDDTTTVIADGEHRWSVNSGETAPYYKDQVLTTEQIAATLRGPRGQRQHRIFNAKPLQLPDAELPIHPYVLGAWLGDGRATGGSISKPLPELWEAIEKCGYELGPLEHVIEGREAMTRTVLGLRTELRLANLLGHKHIPDQYLRASAPQRLALLQGLMDTDGTWNIARNQAVFYTCDKALAYQVYELIVSLGWRSLVNEVERRGFGLTVTSYDVVFTPSGANPFRARALKAAPHIDGTTQSRRRMIKHVESVPTIATQCIAVDSPDNTYLCTAAMIPTHNTGQDLSWSWPSIAVQLAIYANATAIYNPTTHFRDTYPEGFDPTIGLVIHLPAGQARCELHQIDLLAGKTALDLAIAVRNWRKHKNLATPYQPAWAQPAPSETRERMIKRINWIKTQEPAALDALAANWPTNIPTFKQSPTHTYAELAAISSLLDKVESTYAIPF